MDRIKAFLKIKELKTLLFVVILFLGVGCINKDFLSINNIMMCLNGSVVYIVTAIGISFVIISGEIDVSVGATIGLVASVSGMMIRDGSAPLIALMVAVAIGLLIGFINGFGVTKLKIPSIIMTLGTCGIIRGTIYVVTEGKWVENIPLEFKALSQKSIGNNVTYFLIFVLILMIIVHLLLTRTKKGRYFAAVGDNPNGATLLGISVNETKMISFVLCGGLSAFAGVMFVSRVGFITPMAGSGYEMKAIAACVLGGISLTGGVGSVVGSTIGAFLMASISRMLVFIGISSDFDNTITGILLITIVVVDALIQGHSKEKARRERLTARTALNDEKGA